MNIVTTFGLVLLGILFGVIVGVVDGKLRFVRHLAILGRSLAPLILPLLVVAAFVATYYGRFAQLVVGVLLGVLVWRLFWANSKLDKDRPTEAWKLYLVLKGASGQAEPSGTEGSSRQGLTPKQRRRAVAALAIAVGTVIVVLVGAAIAFSGWSDWSESAGRSGWLIWIAVQLLVAGVLIRLCGYATTPRRVAISVLLVVTAAAAATQIGWNALAKGRPWFLVGLVGVLGLLIWEAYRWRDVESEDELPKPSPAHRVFRIGGSWLAITAAACFAVGMAIAYAQTTNGTSKVGGVRFNETVKLAPLEGATREEKLAWTFAPMLRLTTDELYPPTSARPYAARAHGCTEAADPFGPNCQGLRCRPRAPALKDCEREVSTSETTDPHPVTFYARIASRKTDRSTFAAWTPEPVKTLVQYWIFYDYDLWDAQTVLGKLVQKHDADWEFVAVGLDRKDQPIFLALSAHCGGQVVPWDSNLALLPGRVKEGKVVIWRPEQVPTLPKGGEKSKARIGTHPIVAVASGSHGNYADDGSKRPPDWGSCTRVNSKAVGPIVYASNVRDVTASNKPGESRLSQADQIEIVKASTFPMNVVGPWGQENVSFGFRDLGPAGGPRSPPAQSSWGSALRLFFCSPYWHSYATPPEGKC